MRVHELMPETLKFLPFYDMHENAWSKCMYECIRLYFPFFFFFFFYCHSESIVLFVIAEFAKTRSRKWKILQILKFYVKIGVLLFFFFKTMHALGSTSGWKMWEITLERFDWNWDCAVLFAYLSKSKTLCKVYMLNEVAPVLVYRIG